MWPYVREALDGAYVVSLEETAAALRLLAEQIRVVAEGAGALAPAAALSGRTPGGNVVCIVSGGNIDLSVLVRILQGETPK
jgi:threonine dehydratase